MRSNMAVELAPFGRWGLRDEAAQRRLPLRWGLPPIMVHIEMAVHLASHTSIKVGSIAHYFFK